MRKRDGFSLVELTLSLGIISFALVGLLGVISMSLTSGKTSEEDTRMAAMSHTVLDLLRGRSFEMIPFNAPGEAGETEPKILIPIYFDDEGSWCGPDRRTWPEGDPAPRPAQAVYQCLVSVEPDPTSLSPASASNLKPEQRVNLLKVKLLFAWPGHEGSGRLGTHDPVIHASLSRF